jgi:hypothetical protein
VAVLKGLFTLHTDPKPEIIHLTDIAPLGTPDDVWVPLLGHDPCIVISSDAGKGSRPRLPEVCRQYRKTHIILSSGAHNGMRAFQKARAILTLWPELLKVWECEPGSSFLLVPTNTDRTRCRLMQTRMTRHHP